MANVPVHEWTLLEAARKVREKEISSRELTGALLSRIESLDPKVHAYITVLPEAGMATPAGPGRSSPRARSCWASTTWTSSRWARRRRRPASVPRATPGTFRAYRAAPPAERRRRWTRRCASPGGGRTRGGRGGGHGPHRDEVEDAGGGIRGGSEAPHHDRHLRPLRRLLRRVLREGAEGPHPDPRGFREGVRGGGRPPYSHRTHAGVPPRGEDGRSAHDVSFRYLYDPVQPGRHPGDLGPVRPLRFGPPDRGAAPLESFPGGDVVHRRRGDRARPSLAARGAVGGIRDDGVRGGHRSGGPRAALHAEQDLLRLLRGVRGLPQREHAPRAP